MLACIIAACAFTAYAYPLVAGIAAALALSAGLYAYFESRRDRSLREADPASREGASDAASAIERVAPVGEYEERRA